MILNFKFIIQANSESVFFIQFFLLTFSLIYIQLEFFDIQYIIYFI